MNVTQYYGKRNQFSQKCEYQKKIYIYCIKDTISQFVFIQKLIIIQVFQLKSKHLSYIYIYR